MHTQDSGCDGVDNHHPPTGKLFDVTTANTSTDIATMARRHASSSASSGGANVYVNFDGLAEILRGSMAPPSATPIPASIPPAMPTPSASPAYSRSPSVPILAIDTSQLPKMTLDSFFC